MLKSLFYTLLFYGGVLILPYSPGVLAWKLFRNKKGKIRFINRDLICNTETLLALPKSENSLDEFTTAFTPFIPLLTLNNLEWKNRRKILTDGLRKINLDKDFAINIPLNKEDIYDDFFAIFFNIGFELIFGRKASEKEFEAMYPGILDINRLIKRQVAFPDTNLRWKLYHQVKTLIKEKNQNFIFYEQQEFYKLNEINQISIVVEDLLTSICIQCTDLVCHLILLYSDFPTDFKKNLDNCINEALRLYPLTDIWTRKNKNGERGWITSLTQLNRNGWNDPDSFKPQRWENPNHPQLISWGFDSRSCPATRIGYNLSKIIFQKIITAEKIWFQPASNFIHERTFFSGCPVWIGFGQKPSSFIWRIRFKTKNSIRKWINSRIRVLSQRELW